MVSISSGPAEGLVAELGKSRLDTYEDYNNVMSRIRTQSISKNSLSKDEKYYFDLFNNVKCTDEQRVMLAKLMLQRNNETKLLKEKYLQKKNTLENSGDLYNPFLFDYNTLLEDYYGTDYNIAVIYAVNIGEAEQLYDDYMDILTDYVTFLDSTFRLAAAESYRANYFADKVKSGGDWDLKVDLGLTINYDFLYNQKTGEYIGNHHYGYMGNISGYSETVLKTAAGAYQVFSGTSSWDFMDSYFDDPADQQAIEDGFEDTSYDFRDVIPIF
jgi:hypothetical protein